MGLNHDSICNRLWLFGESKAGEKEKKDNQEKMQNAFDHWYSLHRLFTSASAIY